MRTTLAIDDDILAAAKHLAEREHKSVGEVISPLARQGLNCDTRGGKVERNGIPLLPSRKATVPVTLEIVNRLRDEQLANIPRSGLSSCLAKCPAEQVSAVVLTDHDAASMPTKVQDLIARLEADGWFQVRQKGNHRQYHHAQKAGTVTVAGKPSVEVPPGTLNSILKQAGLKK